MPKLLMNLRHVPDDEIAEVRELLGQHGIEYYETPPQRWGISAGGIWLQDEERLDEARRLLEQYQRERQARARAAHEQARREGRAEGMLDLFLRRPLQTILYLAAIIAILYLTLKPFFSLGS